VFFGVLLVLLAIGYMDEGMCDCCCARRETEMLVGWVHAYSRGYTNPSNVETFLQVHRPRERKRERGKGRQRIKRGVIQPRFTVVLN